MDNATAGPTPQITYQLIVAGHMDPAWSDWFDGSVIVQLPDGTTSLTGELGDQAMLYGLLARARDLGLVLLSFQQRPGASPEPASHARSSE